MSKFATRLSNYPKYIREYLIKSFANQSNVALIETIDPKRLEEFKLLIAQEYHHVFIFDVKNGLRKSIQGKKDTRITIQDGFTGEEQSIDNLTAAIRSYEQQLDIFLQNSGEQSSVLICNLDTLSDAERSILRIVASEARYFDQNAHIVLFTPALTSFPIYFRNMCIEIEVELSTPGERKEILDTIKKSFEIPKSINSEQLTEQIVQQLAGINLHDINTVLLESYARTQSIDLDIISHFKEHMLNKMGVELTAKEELGFEAIGGYKVIKEYITKSIIEPLQKTELVKVLGKELPKGILFFGSPGTGKSLFAKSIAKELSMPIVELQTRNFLSKYVGESESNLKQILKTIDAMSPCIVFIDEIDALGNRNGANGGEGDGGTMSRIFGQLLTWMNDQTENIVIATTNAIERLDSAMLRAGRFDQIIPVLLPDEFARLSIILVHLHKRNVPQQLIVEELNTIAEQTEFWTGAELEQLVKNAIDEAFYANHDLVTLRHFELALDNFRINQQDRSKSLKKYLEQAEKYCRDRRFITELEQEQEGTTDRIELVKARMEGL